MEAIRRSLLGALLAVLGSWAVTSARAGEPVFVGQVPHCQRCGRPLAGVAVSPGWSGGSRWVYCPPPGCMPATVPMGTMGGGTAWPVTPPTGQAGMIPAPSGPAQAGPAPLGPSPLPGGPPQAGTPGPSAPTGEPSTTPGAAPTTPETPSTNPESAFPSSPAGIEPPGTGAAGTGEGNTPSLAGSEGLGGVPSQGANAVVMFGDVSPFVNLVPVPVPVPPNPRQPPTPAAPGTQSPGANGAVLTPWIRGFKLADNMSPQPQDRVFFSFNYFNNVGQAVNRSIAAPITNLQAYRYTLGFEKVFLNGNASIGIREPLNVLSATGLVPGFGGTSSALGDLNIFTKFVIWKRVQGPEQFPPGSPFANNLLVAGGGNSSLVSTGLSLTAPTGPSSFAGASYLRSFHTTTLQPYVGYIFTRGNFYIQGFESIDVPMDNRDVTLIYNDIGMGYFIYRNPDPDAFLRGIAPNVEAHANIPLNHRNVYNRRDLNGTPDTVDLTYGANILLGRRSLLSLGVGTPITGPRPFNLEAMAFLNIFY